MLALEIKQLNKNYKSFSLNDVSFQLEKGYIMGFTGLIHTNEFDSSTGINVAIPNLEEIMVYYSKKEVKHV